MTVKFLFTLLCISCSVLQLVSCYCCESIPYNTDVALDFGDGWAYIQTSRCFNETLDVFSNEIKRIKVNSQYLPQLKCLSVSNLPSLTSFFIQQSNLESIDRGAFYNVPKLTEIDFSDNIIESIGNIFDNLYLKNLWLCRSNLKTIEPGAFVKLGTLEQLSLKANLLTELSESWFVEKSTLKSSKLMKLNFFDVSMNRLEKIDPNFFEHLPNINYLALQENRLKELSPNLHLQRCQFLLLYNNRLMYLEPVLLSNLKNVKYLDLRYNPWKCSCLHKVIFVWAKRNPQTNLMLTDDSKKNQIYSYPECVQMIYLTCTYVYEPSDAVYYLNLLRKLGFI